jgi:hypothetical protein
MIKRTNGDGVIALSIHHPPPEDSELRARLEELSEQLDRYVGQLDHPRRLKRRTEDLLDAIGSTNPQLRERVLGRMVGLRSGVTGMPAAVTAVTAAVGAVQAVLDRMARPEAVDARESGRSAS